MRILLALCLLALVLDPAQSRATLSNNGYENVLVAILPEVSIRLMTMMTISGTSLSLR